MILCAANRSIELYKYAKESVWNISFISVVFPITALEFVHTHIYRQFCTVCTIILISAMNNFSGRFFIASILICCICVMANCELSTAWTNARVADPDDCHKYFIYQPIRMSCPAGFIWNASINACDAAKNSPCDQNVQKKQPEGPCNDSKLNRPTAPVKRSPSISKCGTEKKSICYGECIFSSYYSKYRTVLHH